MKLTGTQPEGDIPGGLTDQQDRAIVALLTEPTLTKAAESTGVSERTIYRWLNNDTAFGDAYRKARREAFGQAIGLSQRLAPVALTTLAKIMTDTAATPSSRVSAATALLKFGREALELDDLAARVAALESATPRDQNRSYGA